MNPGTKLIPLMAAFFAIGNSAFPQDQTSPLFTSGLVGINATGDSASGPTQQYSVSYLLATPLLHKNNDDVLEKKWWGWLSPGISSVSSASDAKLSSLTTSDSVKTGIGTVRINQITQSLEFQGGIEFYPAPPKNGAQFGSNQSWARTSISAIAGGGVVVPFAGAPDASEFGLNSSLAQQFQQDPALRATYPQLAAALACAFPAGGGNPPPTCTGSGPTIVDLVFPARTRFYRSFFVGVRLRTFYLSGNCTSDWDCSPAQIYPGTFDFRLGEDESVTAGHLVPIVATLNGTYPIPGTQGILRIFGSVYLRVQGTHSATTLAITPSATFVSPTQPAVVLQPIRPADTDYYHLGVGVDLVPLLNKWFGNKQQRFKRSSPD